MPTWQGTKESDELRLGHVSALAFLFDEGRKMIDFIAHVRPPVGGDHFFAATYRSSNAIECTWIMMSR